MNLPTLLTGLIVLGIFLAIVGRGIYNRGHGRRGCGGDCSRCRKR